MRTTVFRSRLDENMKRATEAWFSDGLKQGLAEGVEQQRSLLGRQVAAKFGAGAARRFAPLLVEVAEADKLADLAVVLLKADSEGELVAEVERIGTTRPR